MIKNFLNIAWRRIQKNKVNSLINIAGLSIGKILEFGIHPTLTVLNRVDVV